MHDWQRDLDAKYALVFIILSAFLFISYERVIAERITAEDIFARARESFQKAASTDQKIIVEKILFYQKAFRLLNDAVRLNPRHGAYYFEFAEAAARIAEQPELNELLDVKAIGGTEAGATGFYALAKRKYAEAVDDDPANPIYHQRLGSIYDRLSDAGQARQELKKAALLDPQNVSILIYLSRYFLSAGMEGDFIRYRGRLVDIYKSTVRQDFTGEIESFLQSIGQEDLIRDFKK